MTLFIGSVIGGRDHANEQIIERINELSQRVEVLANSSPSEVSVDVVFHIPGPLLRPDYSGVRTGKFSFNDRTLMVQIAVPGQLEKEKIDDFLIASLNEAVDLAEKYFRQRQLDWSVESLREQVKKLGSSSKREN